MGNGLVFVARVEGWDRKRTVGCFQGRVLEGAEWSGAEGSCGAVSSPRVTIISLVTIL